MITRLNLWVLDPFAHPYFILLSKFSLTTKDTSMLMKKKNYYGFSVLRNYFSGFFFFGYEERFSARFKEVKFYEGPFYVKFSPYTFVMLTNF